MVTRGYVGSHSTHVPTQRLNLNCMQRVKIWSETTITARIDVFLPDFPANFYRQARNEFHTSRAGAYHQSIYKNIKSRLTVLKIIPIGNIYTIVVI